MIRVTAPSRLHFGLLGIPSEAEGIAGAAEAALHVRHFGGIGVMIDKPGVCVRVEPASAWTAHGPLADRALCFARDFMRTSPEFKNQAWKITVEHTAPEHAGLGTGTQLGLSVARALAIAMGRADLDAASLARRIGRGQRSGIGVHGFAQGGFLVDGGKSPATPLAPLIARHDFPSDWGILLVLPKAIQGAHGLSEQKAFAALGRCPEAGQNTAALCRLVLLGVLPALLERDLATFGEALHEYNRRVGEMFTPWQGGVYAHPRTTAVVDFLRRSGITGVGQSSWGPAVFALHTKERLTQLSSKNKKIPFSQDEMLICSADNRGAVAEAI